MPPEPALDKPFEHKIPLIPSSLASFLFAVLNICVDKYELGVDKAGATNYASKAQPRADSNLVRK
jgi:hypothetical protein